MPLHHRTNMSGAAAATAAAERNAPMAQRTAHKISSAKRSMRAPGSSVAASIGASMVSHSDGGGKAGAEAAASALARALARCDFGGYEDTDSDAAAVERASAAARTRGIGGGARTVAVRASAAPYLSHLSQRSIGAPASTSLLADTGGLTTGGGKGSPFDMFFGETRDSARSDYDIDDQTTWTLPQIYQGLPLPILSDTIEQLTFLEGTWYQSEVAPIEVTTAMGVSWTHHEFNAHLTDVVPELGVTRLVQSRRIKNSARFVRRGLGFMLEHGFMNTEEGRRHYLANVNQLVQAAVETNKFDLIHSLLGAHDQNRLYLSESGLYAQREVIDFVRQEEVDNWDVVKKQKNGLRLLETRSAERMARWRGQADTWIIHPDIAAYFTQQRTENTDFLIAGAQGPQTLREGPDAFTEFAGNRVYKTRGFHVTENDPVDLMSFPAQIGEHHFMSELDTGDDTAYRSRHRDVQLFDEGRDKFTTVRLAAALAASRRFDDATGAVLGFDDVGRGHSSHYSDDERAADVLHYRAADGSVRPVDYFVNVDAAHLPAEARVAIGASVRAQLGALANGERADALLASVRTAVAQMESYEWNDATKAYLDAIGGGFGAARLASARPAGTASTQPLLELSEYPVATTGSVPLPANAAGDPRGLGLPPGFQSWEGIKEIVAKWRTVKDDNGAFQASLLRNVSRALLDDLEAFVDFFAQVIVRLRALFPDSEMLAARNAASWWQRPDAGTVLFNNAVHKARVPLWFRAGGAVLEGAAGGGIGLRAQQALASRAEALQRAANAVVAAAGGAPLGAQLATILNVNYEELVGQIDAANAGQFSDLLQNHLYVTLLVANVNTDGAAPEDVAAKLEAISAKVVGPFFPTAERLAAAPASGNDLSVAVKALAKTKGFFRQSAKAIDAIATETFGAIQDALAATPAPNAPLGSTDAGMARTTLLAAPRLLSGMAAALNGDAAAELTWLPSNPQVPDLPLDGLELVDEAEAAAAGPNGARAAAFIDAPLAALSERERVVLSAGGGFEFVQAANAADEVARQFPGEAADNMAGAFIGASAAAAAAAGTEQHIGAMFDDDVAAAGEAYGAGRIDDVTAGGGGGARLGGAQPSRRGLSQGFSHFFAAREALASGVARENFLELALVDGGSWADVVAFVFNYARVTRQQLERMIAADVRFPFNFILARPHARYQTGYAIKLLRGAQTVVTYQRRGRFEVGDDAQVGAHVGNYTYYSKVVVKQPKNVMLLRNIYVRGYDGGMGSEFVSMDDYRPYDGKYGTGSVFALLVAYTETDETVPAVLNLSGAIDDMVGVYQLYERRGLHYSSAPFYAALWGWRRGQSYRTDESYISEAFVNRKERINFNTLKGKTMRIDPVTGQFTLVDSGRGHWGDEATYNGCAAARRGAAQYSPPSAVAVKFV